MVGDAEGIWETVVADAAAGRLQPLYRSKPGQGGAPAYDRSIYGGRRYAPISLVQVGRGCRFACDFCSIHAFYGTYRDQRDPARRRAEMRTLPRGRMVFFVDDNLYWRRDAFERLMRALIPLKMRWCCQITIDVARDDALLDLMAEAGCALALIGFESLDRDSLVQMRKKWNGVAGGYDDVISRFHARGIMIYGTFVFGYDADTRASFDARRRVCPRAVARHRQFQSAHADAGHRALRPAARGRPAHPRGLVARSRPTATAMRSSSRAA